MSSEIIKLEKPSAAILIPPYRGKIARTHWDEVMSLADSGVVPKKIRQHLQDTHGLSFSEDSVRTVIRYVRKERRRALDDTLVESVQMTTQQSLSRLEQQYQKFEKLVDQAVTEGNLRLANSLQDKVLRALAMQLDMVKDTRDKNKGVPEDDIEEQDLDKLRQDVLRRLNLRLPKHPKQGNAQEEQPATDQ